LQPIAETGQAARMRKMLLTSAGARNAAIHGALVDLLGKPIEGCAALCIPTAMYGHPYAGPGPSVWEFVAGRSEQPMVELGWKSVSLLELTALPTIQNDKWVTLVQEADVLIVSGGDALYLHHWMRECGLTELLPSLDAVWFGMSAGSMVMTPRIGKEFVGWKPPAGGDAALGLVDFAIFPHLDHPSLPENTLAAATAWAAALDCPAYAIDDETAIRIVDGEVDVVSEGRWHHFDGPPAS
jgi:dipeptidase E